MPSWIAIALSLSFVACSKQDEKPPPPPRPKPAKIEALALKPLPDKKLEVSFRVLDVAGKPMRAYSVGYMVLGCDASPSISGENYDAAKNELATFVANLEFCGRPPDDHKVKLDLRVGMGEAISASAAVDATASYERTGPRSLAELETELARLSTSGMNDTDPPFATKTPEIGLIGLVSDRIVEMGAPAVPKLVPVWQSGPSQIRARVAAAVIGKLDPALLVKDTVGLLDRYDEAFVADPKARTSGMARAAAAGVYGADEIDRAAAADVYFRALSSPDAEVSGMAATWIKQRLPRDTAIGGLFRYMAAKQSYKQREIDIYVAVIERFGPESSATVAKNLDALLAAAGKKPDKVFWAHKVVGLTALQKIGQPAAVPTIEKYKADKARFVSTKQELDALGNPKGLAEHKDIAFAALAKDALAAIAKR